MFILQSWVVVLRFNNVVKACIRTLGEVSLSASEFSDFLKAILDLSLSLGVPSGLSSQIRDFVGEVRFLFKLSIRSI